MPKTCEKGFYKNIRVTLCKNRRKKHQIFEKWDDFENRPSSKGFSLCEMVSLGQKLKMPKPCEKRVYKNIRVVLCKKRLEKISSVREMRRLWKSAILQGHTPCKGYSPCKMVSLGEKLKMPKACKKWFYNKIRFVLCKNLSKKHQIFEKWDDFDNRASSKGYSLKSSV